MPASLLGSSRKRWAATLYCLQWEQSFGQCKMLRKKLPNNVYKALSRLLMKDAIEVHSFCWKFSLPPTALFLGKYLALLNNTAWSGKINSCNYPFPQRGCAEKTNCLLQHYCSQKNWTWRIRGKIRLTETFFACTLVLEDATARCKSSS